MKTIRVSFLVWLSLIACSTRANAHGFNADKVYIVHLLKAGYRIYISYTHVKIGEYREASVDFKSREEALRVYWDLANGADFFLGDIKNSIHFHNPIQKNKAF